MAKSADRIQDELLVLKCQDGDVDALTQLVSRWQSSLHRHAWYLTQDSEATRDIVQDAWLDIVRTIRRLKDPASFRGWAFRIVSNKAADWIRRKERQRAVRKEVAFEKQNERDVAPGDEGGSNSQSLVRQCIQSLPSNCRQILSMKYTDRMSTREIAEALDIPIGTVKSRLHYARRQLKKEIQRSEK